MVYLIPVILRIYLSSNVPVSGTVNSKSIAAMVKVRLKCKSETPRSITAH